jgi:ribosome maturation factor RimP
MHTQDTELSKLYELAERSIDSNQTFIVDIEVKGSSSAPIIWLYLESEKGGISLDECAVISRRLQVTIEANGLFGDTFTLNVSSPGLDRPLKQKKQYKVNTGRNAKVKYTQEGSVKLLEGVITDSDEDTVTLKSNGALVRLDYATIIETKIQPVF